MTDLTGLKIQLTGIVQGVGFRPFVYNLAESLGLKGWIKNTSAGVEIEVEGEPDSLKSFMEALQNDIPVLARIDTLSSQPKQLEGFTSFQIIASKTIESAFQPISPDISICPDCLRELFDPSDRRYRYPFINCTNCGPRLTIIEDIPYDRPATTMKSFPMCPDCEEEYHNPRNRRFHAQPIACAKCGPHVWLESTKFSIKQDTDPILETQRLLSEGAIVAIKGLGGFHLACDAANPQAVEILRDRKLRVDKPFALMMPDLETVREFCLLNEDERILLESPQRPIVILRRRTSCSLPKILSPGQNTLGVMLPYTPLHYLLFSQLQENYEIKKVLVMTSGNVSEEPIAIDNQDALTRLSPLTDAFLLHNRPIRTRCDDSVVRVTQVAPQKYFPIRRSRGYAPLPIRMAWDSLPLLAVGTELKNTFCLARGHYAFLSHHIGDMENYETLQSFEQGIAHYESLFRIEPALIACDLHPDYLATQYAHTRAEQEQIPLFQIQHHHAHITACMAENDIPPNQKVIGVSFDGTGYGEDGAIWGGEFIIAGYDQFQRLGHIRYLPLPGGDAAIHNPARVALAYLWAGGLEWSPGLPPVQALSSQERNALQYQLENHINTIQTSSMGRLFDSIAALLGIRVKVNYEAQAAIELEALADPRESGLYPFDLPGNNENMVIIDPAPILSAIVRDYLAGQSLSQISARFHNTVVEIIRRVLMSMRNAHQVNTVALSGGVWQNLFLLSKTVKALSCNGFKVLTHSKVPPNDGGVSLGQAVTAYHRYIGEMNYGG
jgi:hydrogenase maturation protein HypF